MMRDDDTGDVKGLSCDISELTALSRIKRNGHLGRCLVGSAKGTKHEPECSQPHPRYLE